MSLRAPRSNGYDTWTQCSKKVSTFPSRWQLLTDSNCIVLRLYPSVPVNSRSAVRTTTLPVGGGPDGKSTVLVRKGEAVGFCPYAMHRREDIFGPDAALFRPERWLERDGQLATNAGFGYLPFNAGPRLCLGREYLWYLREAIQRLIPCVENFALLEASFVIVQILRRFPRLTVPADEPVESIGDERQLLTLVVAVLMDVESS